MNSYRYPLSAGARHPEQWKYLSVNGLQWAAVSVLPLEGALDEVLLLEEDLILYRWDGAAWVPLTGSSGGVGGTTYLAHFGDANPVTIFSLPASQALDSIDITVVEAWDGTGARIKLGVAGDFARYFDTTETDLTAVAAFSKDFSELGPIDLVLTIDPGTTPTSGQVRIQVSTTLSGN